MFPWVGVNGGNVGASVACARWLGFTLGYVVLVCLMLSSEAMANMTITAPGIDMTTMGSYATTILAALAGVWLVRKFVKTTNRS